MKGYKYFAKNVGILTLGNFGTKLLVFFLIPLYTNVLTTEEYGIYDIFSTTVSLLIPFLTMNICEAVLRFSIDDHADCMGILSIGFRFFFRGFFLIVLFTGLNYIVGWIPVLEDYAFVFVALYAVSALAGIMASFARGLDRLADISVSGVLCTVVIIAANILFLLVFRWGILGYFAAAVLGSLTQIIYLFVRTKMWNYINFRYRNPGLAKEMLDYSRPLIANSVAWWINNASDRYILIWYCGMAENGIYSVGYKIPSILNVFQSIFSQAWVLSAVRDFDPEDRNGFFSKMYNMYNCMMVIMCSVLILMDKLLARFLYAEDFYEAWKYVPFLTIAIVFGAMSGYIGGIFSAVKDSKIFAQSTVAGAVANIMLNVVLIYMYGAMGAAAATAVSYVLVWIIRLLHMKRCMNIKLYIARDVLAYCMLIVQMVFLLVLQNDVYLYMAELLGLVSILFLFRKETVSAVVLLIRKVKEKKS